MKMITNTIGDKYINANIQGKPYIYSNGASTLAGAVMYDISTQKYKINNGTNWVDCDATVSLTLSMDAHRALDWALQKIKREQEYAELARNNVSVQDALQSLVMAQERLDIVTALARNEDTNV